MIDGHGGNVYELARRLGCAPAELATRSATGANQKNPVPSL